MKVSKRQLRKSLRRALQEVRVYAGSKDTPSPSKVERWAKQHGFKCYDYRGYPYPKICALQHPSNPDAKLEISAHRNMSLGTSFIKVSSFEYTEENPRGNSPEYHYKDKNAHSLEELEDLLGGFYDYYEEGYGEGL